MKLIVGVPGSGKTQYAVNKAKSHNGNTLYLSFSAENAKSAAGRFGKHAKCMSIHACALSVMNVKRDRITDSWGNAQLNQLNKLGVIDLQPGIYHLFLELFSKFIMSRTPHFSVRGLISGKEFRLIDDQTKSILQSTLMKVWAHLWTADSSFPISHDMYLKKSTEIVNKIPYSLILVDEMQDLNESMMAFLIAVEKANPDAEMYLMGDPCQQIFGYRGVSDEVNAMTPEESLTETRRFGPKVSVMMNAFMKTQGIHHYTPIRSAVDTHTDVHESPGWAQLFTEAKQGRKITVITRLNMSLWFLAKTLTDLGIRFAVKGQSFSDLDFLESLLQAYQISTGRIPASKHGNKHRYKQFKDRAYASNNSNDITACKLIESIPSDKQNFFAQMRNFISDEQSAQVLLTNIHQAKGLQFNDVVIAGDFQSCIEPTTGLAFKIQAEEVYTIYTAITRCKSKLTLPKDWYRFYKGTQSA